MIDDDFTPDRLQYRALGHLLVHANNFPLSPFIREADLLQRVYGRYVDPNSQDWLAELAQHKLLLIVVDESRVGDGVGLTPKNVCLTAAGIYYCISRSLLFAESARTPTDDFPDEIIDTPWALQTYFAPSGDETAPTADSYVRFDHNQEAYDSALDSLDAAYQALAADNEIGSQHPVVRDEKLSELRAIRELLEKREGWSAKLIAAGWGALGYLITRFADRPVAYLAEQAWQALQALVGHH